MNRAQPVPVDARKALRHYALLDPDAMTLPKYRETKQALAEAVQAHASLKPCCQSCAHFDAGRCELFKQDVPPEFQQAVEECEDWLLNPVPIKTFQSLEDMPNDI